MIKYSDIFSYCNVMTKCFNIFAYRNVMTKLCYKYNDCGSCSLARPYYRTTTLTLHLQIPFKVKGLVIHLIKVRFLR